MWDRVRVTQMMFRKEVKMRAVHAKSHEEMMQARVIGISRDEDSTNKDTV